MLLDSISLLILHAIRGYSLHLMLDVLRMLQPDFMKMGPLMSEAFSVGNLFKAGCRGCFVERVSV